MVGQDEHAPSALQRLGVRRCDGRNSGSGEALVSRPAKEEAMCYSRDWQADAERKRQEAKAREAHDKRAGVIHELRTGAEKQAEKAKEAPEPAPAK
jgi:hypothetical protein